MKWPTHILAVGGIVENDKNEILLVKTPWRGWEFPGGQVEVGENLITALLRELKEESGVTAEVSHLIGLYSNTKINKGLDDVEVPTKLMLDFACTYVGGELTCSEETTEVCWVPKNEVLDRVKNMSYRTRFQAYLDYKGEVNYMEYVTQPEFLVKLERKL